MIISEMVAWECVVALVLIYFVRKNTVFTEPVQMCLSNIIIFARGFLSSVAVYPEETPLAGANTGSACDRMCLCIYMK